MIDLQEITLSERMLRGPLAAGEVLRVAGLLADALRRLHDRGMVCGTLAPSRIVLHGADAALVDAAPVFGVTPYSAPEQVQGGAADSRSDIFAFGAVLYEMATGRKAFPGEGEELRSAILERDAAPLTGEASALAKLVGRCLAKAPAQRWQRIQSVQMELKLLHVMARREQSAESLEKRFQTLVRTEVAGLEERLSTRVAAVEGAAAELRAHSYEQREKLQAAAQATETLRGHVASLTAGVDAGREQMAARLQNIDAALAAHTRSIESLGTAIAQSDDLIERLVDAFEGLEQTASQRSAGAVSAG